MTATRLDARQVENEPWAVICWQARLLAGWLQSSARFVVFTWENLVRPGVKGRILSVIYRASTLTTDGYIAGNKRAAEILVKHGAGKEKVLVAPQLGVDLANHHPVGEREKMRLRVVNGLPPDAFIAGYCGRLSIPPPGINGCICCRRGRTLTFLISSAAWMFLSWQASR